MTEAHRELRMSGEAGITIAASPKVLYQMVSDVTRMGEWSPQARTASWIDAPGPAVGARFRTENGFGDHTWTMRSTVTRAEPGRVFEFHTENSGQPATYWRYEFAPEGDGTRVTERFEWTWAPAREGFRAQTGAVDIEDARRMVAERQGLLVENMRSTLASLKAAAEG